MDAAAALPALLAVLPPDDGGSESTHEAGGLDYGNKRATWTPGE
jgi:hypothetical protein